MTANLFKALFSAGKKESGPRIAVLVTGGFHSQGMLPLLRDRGATVVQFTPKVTQVKESAQELPVVNINRQADLFLNEKPITIGEIPDAIHQRFGWPKAVYLRADRQTPWEPIAQVAAALGEAKFQVNLVTQPDDSLSKGK